jgi:hypothetical protein
LRRWTIAEVAERLPGSYTTLLGLLLAFILIPPFFETPSGRSGIIIPLLLTAVLLGTLKVFTHGRTQFLIGLGLAIPSVVGRWAIMFTSNPTLLVLFSLAWVLFLAFAVGFVLHSVLTARRVTYDTISGAICGYLLYGLMCSFIFALIEMFYPGSFYSADSSMKLHGHPGHVHQELIQFIYFSLVTLASVGYGDIIPVTPPARAVAAIEGISGQFYIAVLIARLVSLHSSRWTSE